MAEEMDETEQAEDGRRAFLKKMAIGTAFAAPVVSSFSMTGVSAAYAGTPTASGDIAGETVTTSPQTTTTTTMGNTNTNLP